MERVQKSTHNKDLDFVIFCHIARGSYPSKIAKEMEISKTRANYHIASLKERDLIAMKGQGVWIALKNYEPKESKKTT